MDPIIILLRILVPLGIFRFPLIGGFLSLWLDGQDWFVNFFNTPNLHQNYNQIDKLLDIYYLSIEAYVVWGWRNVSARSVGLGLFLYRAVGVILFELTHARVLFFVFPNIFESFFIFYLGCRTLLRREPKISPKLLALSVITLFIPKMIQEYPMHVKMLWQWRYITVTLFSKSIVFQYDNIFHQFLIIVGLMVVVSFIVSRHPHVRHLWRMHVAKRRR